MSERRSGTREAFVAALHDLAPGDERVVLVCADSLKAMRATGFQEQYPERTFDVGICEQAAVAFAAGLATCGLVPYVATYAGFLTMRACEQMRSFVGYPHLPVKFVGANGGMYGGEREGVTHQFYEDLAIARVIPGMTVVAPADAVQVRQAVKAVAAIDGPAYIRVGSKKERVLHAEDAPFELGKIEVMRRLGSDVALLAHGPILHRVLLAADALKTAGIGATVVNVHTLWPVDRDGLAEVLRETGAAVTVEDHNVVGALGSLVAEVAGEEAPVPLARVGLRDTFAESGEEEALWDKYGLKADDIVAAAKRVLGRKRS